MMRVYFAVDFKNKLIGHHHGIKSDLSYNINTSRSPKKSRKFVKVTFNIHGNKNQFLVPVVHVGYCFVSTVGFRVSVYIEQFPFV